MSANTRLSDRQGATAAQANYQPQDRVQVQPGLPFNAPAGHGQLHYQQAFPSGGDWRKPPGRWRDFGILLGLWSLVFLVAAVVGVRLLGFDAAAPEPNASLRESAAPASRVGPAALAASRLAEDDDPFDDPLPALPAAPAAPAALAAPSPRAPGAAAAAGMAPPAEAVAAPGASTGMPAASAQRPGAAAGALALAPELVAPRPAPAAARMPPACPPALAAMQLCNETPR